MSDTGSHPAADLKMKSLGWPHWIKVIGQNNVTNHKWWVFELCFVFHSWLSEHHSNYSYWLATAFHCVMLKVHTAFDTTAKHETTNTISKQLWNYLVFLFCFFFAVSYFTFSCYRKCASISASVPVVRLLKHQYNSCQHGSWELFSDFSIMLQAKWVLEAASLWILLPVRLRVSQFNTHSTGCNQHVIISPPSLKLPVWSTHTDLSKGGFKSAI